MANTNKRKRRTGADFGIWIIVLAVALLVLVFADNTYLFNAGDYTYTDFQNSFDDKRDQIKSLYIEPNRETPTGMVEVTWSDDDSESFYVTDVNDVQQWLDEQE